MCRNECCNIDQLNYYLMEYVLCTQKGENIYVVKDEIVNNRHTK